MRKNKDELRTEMWKVLVSKKEKAQVAHQSWLLHKSEGAYGRFLLKAWVNRKIN